jgi:hypothetical protein
MANTYVQIGSTVTVGSGGAASIDFTSIPSTYTDLQLVYSARCVSGGPAGILLTLNGSTSSFTARYLRGDGSSASSSTFNRYVGAANGSGDTASSFSSNAVYIPNYAGSTNKSYSVDSVTENNGTTAYQTMIAGLWSNTSAITSLSLTVDASLTFAQYSTASLYGIKNS